MDFYYPDTKYHAELKDEFEKDVERQIHDLVGPDRWFNGKVYLPIIDKKYEPDTTGDMVEIIVKIDKTSEHLQLWLDGWRIAKCD